MKMKTILLTLCVGLAFLAGCGRSKPEASKTAGVDTSALENTATPPPPDQLPPKSAPVAAAPVQAATPPQPNAVPFGPLPPTQDRAGEATRQKLADAARKIAENKKGAEQEQKRMEEALRQQQSGTGDNNGQEQ